MFVLYANYGDNIKSNENYYFFSQLRINQRFIMSLIEYFLF